MMSGSEVRGARVKVFVVHVEESEINTGAICCDPRSGIDKYSATNEEKKPSEKHEGAKPQSVFHEVFSRVWSEYLKFC